MKTDKNITPAPYCYCVNVHHTIYSLLSSCHPPSPTSCSYQNIPIGFNVKYLEIYLSFRFENLTISKSNIVLCYTCIYGSKSIFVFSASAILFNIFIAQMPIFIQPGKLCERNGAFIL